MKFVLSNPQSGLAIYMDAASKEKIERIGPRLRYDETKGNTVCIQILSEDADALRGTGATRIQKNAPKGNTDYPYKVVFPHRGPGMKFGMVPSHYPKLSADKSRLELELPAQLPAAISRRPKIGRDLDSRPWEADVIEHRPVKKNQARSTEVRLEIAGQTFAFELPEGEVLNSLLNWTEKGYRKTS